MKFFLVRKLFLRVTEMITLNKTRIYLCAVGLFLSLAVLFVVCSMPVTHLAKKRDSVVLEWRAKFYELETAEASYRESNDDPDRIFPKSFGDLHQWTKNEESSLLKSKHDLLDFEASVSVNYRTYDEIANDGVDPSSSSFNGVSLVEKTVVGGDGITYKIQLLAGGLVKITGQGQRN